MTLRQVDVINAGDVRPQAVRWLYDQRVPLGKLTVLAGRPGLGKSLWTTDLAAGVSNGVVGGALLHRPAHVLIATAEDDPQDTVVPRLTVAGADLRNVGLLDLTEIDADGQLIPGTISLPDDVPAIAEQVKAHESRLIVVDPITGYLDAKHSAYSNQEVRRALAPLAELARTHDCAVVAVMHLNKSNSTDPLARIADSGAFTALARSVLLFGADPDDPEGDHGSRRVLTVAKGNLKQQGTHAVTLEVKSASMTTPFGDAIDTARIEVTGTSTASAEDVLGGNDERSAGEEARRFLENELAAGPRTATDVHDAARDAGIAETTLNRVKRKIGVRSTREGGKGPWSWQLPNQPTPASHLDHLDHVDHLAPQLDDLDGLDSQEALKGAVVTETPDEIHWDFTTGAAA